MQALPHASAPRPGCQSLAHAVAGSAIYTLQWASAAGPASVPAADPRLRAVFRRARPPGGVGGIRAACVRALSFLVGSAAPRPPNWPPRPRVLRGGGSPGPASAGGRPASLPGGPAARDLGRPASVRGSGAAPAAPPVPGTPFRPSARLFAGLSPPSLRAASVVPLACGSRNAPCGPPLHPLSPPPPFPGKPPRRAETGS